MVASPKIIDLRNVLAERFPGRPITTATRLVTGLAFLDEPIGSGLPRSAITELISPRISTGSASLIQALIYGACRDNYFLALIDGRDSFDPCGLDNPSLRHLLWLRCSKTYETIKATDLLLRDGNFPLSGSHPMRDGRQRATESCPRKFLELENFGNAGRAFRDANRCETIASQISDQ